MESRYQSICRSCTYSSYFIRLRQQNSRERISTKRGAEYRTEYHYGIDDGPAILLECRSVFDYNHK